MSMIGEFYEDEVVQPLEKQLERARKYIWHLIRVLEDEGYKSYYADGETIPVQELRQFLKETKKS